MNVRKCTMCGWEYPPTYKRAKCKLCDAVLPNGVCYYCKKFVDLVDGLYCQQCSDYLTAIELDTIAEKDYKSTKKKAKLLYDGKYVDLQYQYWLRKVDAVPPNYPTLREDQWLKACMFFKGCAVCRDEEIETRGYFVPFKDNGKYCDWNIIPLCGHCSGDRWRVPNPFKRLKNINTIVDYLGPKLEEAVNWKT